MRRTLMIIGLAVVAVLMLSGCMTQFGSSSGKLAYAEIDGAPQGEIAIEKSFIYIIHPDLFIAGEKMWENIDSEIDPVLTSMGADAVRDLELGYGATLMDMILSSVVPLVNWGTFTVEGEAVTR